MMIVMGRRFHVLDLGLALGKNKNVISVRTLFSPLALAFGPGSLDLTSVLIMLITMG